jgi:hypothetical protein
MSLRILALTRPKPPFSRTSMIRASGTTDEHSRRIAERDWRDGRDEVGIQSVHGACFALHAPRSVALANFFSILLNGLFLSAQESHKPLGLKKQDGP